MLIILDLNIYNIFLGQSDDELYEEQFLLSIFDFHSNTIF